MSKHYKHPTYGMVFCNDELNTPPGRGAWFSLVTPKDPPPPKPGEQPGKPRFEATLLLEKDTPKTDLFLSELATLAAEMQDVFNDGKSTKISIESIVKDGDFFDNEKYPYYKNHWVLVARNASQPETYDVNAESISPSAFVGGQKIRMRIQPLVTSHGLSYKLKVVQLLMDDGVRFAGGTKDYKSLMSVLEDGESSDAATEEVPAQTAAPTPQPVAIKPVAAGTQIMPRKPGRPAGKVVQAASVAAPVAAPVAPKVNPASLRAQAAAKVQAQPKKGIGLALDKI